MKRLLIAAGVASLLFLPRMSSAQGFCRVTVEAQVEVAPGKLSLADLLSTDSCPGVARAAAEVDLGSAPLAGSVRVLAAAEVRARLQNLAGSLPNRVTQLQAVPEMFIPERVSIRRAGARASCADIGARLLTASEVFPSSPALTASKSVVGTMVSAAPGASLQLSSPMECGAAGRIPQQTPVQMTRTEWDPALGTWDVSARCVRSADCVPFLVRVPGSAAERALVSSPSSSPKLEPIAEKPVVRRGETVILRWDQNGIRLAVPAVCLDAGAEGQRVRARIVNGGRTLPAIVVSAGVLRTAS